MMFSINLIIITRKSNNKSLYESAIYRLSYKLANYIRI